MDVMADAEPRLRWSRLIVEAGLVSGWEEPVDPEISAVVEDSRLARPGACFVARRGATQDGHAYVDQAVRAGASAIISELFVPLPERIARLQLPAAAGVAGRLAAILHGIERLQRQQRLRLIGVTGTNGKSTFCYLLRAILDHAGFPTALLGTIQYDLLSRVVEAEWTTPPAPVLMGHLAEAARAGATHAVMEVSSHALDQGRCDGVLFAAGVFTNLTGDHLDYHKSMEAYGNAKKRLFDGLDAGAVAVINADDPAGERMIADSRARVVRYAVAPEHADRPAADMTACIHAMDAVGTRFALVDQAGGAACDVVTSLIGRHNVENCLAAAATGVALGVSLDAVAAGLAGVAGVPGRLQRVRPAGARNGKPRADLPEVVVDYAHTDDALTNVLSALRPLTRGRLIVMFGCGGDRDRSKRPRMARAAAALADRIIVTSDNPRGEDPEAIIADVLAGFAPADRARVAVEADRRSAIALAIRTAVQGDVVLLAGKGHETYQEINGRRLPFDDAAVAAEVLA